MSSPILEYIYRSTGIDPAYFLFISVILLLVVIVLMITVLCKLKKLHRDYDKFMRGKDAESLEDILLSCVDKTRELDEINETLQEEMKNIRRNQRITYQKMGMVKYDAFRGMSGNLSYVLALLDQKDNGFILNSVYSREGGYSYMKEIVRGECDTLLSEEEKEALEKAKSQA